MSSPTARKSGALPRIVPEHPDDIVLDLSLDDASDERLKQQVLAEVVQHAARMTQAVALAREMKTWPWRPLVLASLALVTLLFTATVFIAYPDWAVGASPALMSDERREAGTRLAMYLTAARLQEYRDTHGVYPASLADVGEGWPGVAYTNVDNAVFLLQARANGTALVLRSDDDPRRFLGISKHYLRVRP